MDLKSTLLELWILGTNLSTRTPAWVLGDYAYNLQEEIQEVASDPTLPSPFLLYLAMQLREIARCQVLQNPNLALEDAWKILSPEGLCGERTGHWASAPAVMCFLNNPAIEMYLIEDPMLLEHLFAFASRVGFTADKSAHLEDIQSLLDHPMMARWLGLATTYTFKQARKVRHPFTNKEELPERLTLFENGAILVIHPKTAPVRRKIDTPLYRTLENYLNRMDFNFPHSNTSLSEFGLLQLADQQPPTPPPKEAKKSAGKKATSIKGRVAARIGETSKEEAIRRLAETDPTAALASEDCPVDVWWEKAEAYPIHAMESVLFDLNTLAEPERWHALEKRKAENWYDALVKATPALLSNPALRLLAVECAAKVLPLFEGKYPEDPRPALAIKEAILFAFDRSTKERLTKAVEAAGAAAVEAARAAYSAADSAADSAEARAAWAADSAAAWAAYSAAGAAYSAAAWGAGAAAGKITRQEFYAWAWQRALAFFYAPNQLPSPWDQFPELPPPYDRIMATGEEKKTPKKTTPKKKGGGTKRRT